MQPEIFELTVDPAAWNRYQIEGEHPVSLPALSCDVCGSTWKSTGESYPTVELSNDDRDFLRSKRVLSIETFEEWRNRLRPLVPPGAPLYPGASFGSFRGTAKGRLLDLSWHESWTMFVHLDAWVALKARNVQMPRAGVPQLRSTVGKAGSDLYEPEAVPVMLLSREGLADPQRSACSRCGRQAGGFEKFLVDDNATVPIDADLFRAQNNPAVYLATARFVEAAQELELTGFVAKRLSLVDTAQRRG